MNKRHFSSGKKKWALITASAAILLSIAGVAFSEQLREGYELTSTWISPNPQVEYEYGERHFDANQPKAYNFVLAEYFFRKALERDTTIPYLYHEIARIDFLKGNFSQAYVEITLQVENQGDKTPNSYYIKGLIEGYMGSYDTAAADYEHFIKFEPKNWAALNDYAWVLLKANRYKDAYDAAMRGLAFDPKNPWLLNSSAIALFEMGNLKDAKIQAQKAEDSVKLVTTDMWLHAYPGNDPKIAAAGVQAFRTAAEDNMHSILAATSTHALQ